MKRCGWMGALVVCLGLGWGGAQGLTAQTEDGAGDKLRVFFDCKAIGCFDLDFFRREITWVNWVRDREDSDVHVMITFQRAGGGFSFQFAFIGVGDFEGQNHNLTGFSSGTDTTDEQRTMIASKTRLGLVAYAAETSQANLLSVVYQDPTATGEGPPAQVTPENDPWNLWVFNVRVSGSKSGESRLSSANVSSGLGANRVSDVWKFTSSVNFSYRESNFEVSDEETITSFRRSMGANVLLVKSIGPHWGVGTRGNINSATFQNHDLRVSIEPAIEYNIFPYSESSRRSFTFQYRIGPEFVRYDEETIFDKTEEWLFKNSLTATLGVQQPWGGASFSLSGSTHLNDFEKNSISTFGNVNFRITRGLRLNFGGSASRIRNRINLPKSEATEQDILLRQIILGTSFSFRFNVGLTYRFGSIFNNIVNPRFDSGFFFFF